MEDSENGFIENAFIYFDYYFQSKIEYLNNKNKVIY